ncbi:metallophosphoesterase family protein [Pseudobutyrivibrio sp. MD2005]|uniref:metallophosphoesterase family protein n=1 Tax=Pseudobutyrivibrio sp. MD2005 TaxID=1410616 RepID=UPI0004842295|nr:DNA repair exonuclease [Pseudobutyrivibrio sp. MD2005]
MKIIHCADLHLDSKMESNLDKEQASLRRIELVETYERMVKYAKDNGVRAILIAGDLFDKSHIRKDVKRRVVEQILDAPEIDFYYLKGNHDRCDFMEEGIDDIPSNFHMFNADGWTSYECDDVVITGMELNSSNVSTMAQRLVLDSANTNIVMLHGQQSDYDGKDGAEIINTTSLKGKFIDYLALGHVHKFIFEPLDDRGVYCYPGCLEGRGFDETGDKGFILMDIENGEITSEFIPFALRRLHEINVEVTAEMDMQAVAAKARELLLDVDDQDLVKFVLTGERELDDELDVIRFVRIFENKYFFVKCYDRTKTLVDYESYKYDKSLKGEFVRLVQSQDMDEDEKAKIIEIGIRAIMGEDI